MSLSDTANVDAAVLAVLTADAALRALLPGGVWVDLTAGQNPTRYGLVTQFHHEDAARLQGDGWERVIYVVKAVMLDTSGVNPAAAAYRIHQLLHDARYPVAGYNLMLSQRIERVRYTERDDVTAANWHHCGGQYELTVQPTGAGLEVAA